MKFIILISTIISFNVFAQDTAGNIPLQPTIIPLPVPPNVNIIPTELNPYSPNSSMNQTYKKMGLPVLNLIVPDIPQQYFLGGPVYPSNGNKPSLPTWGSANLYPITPWNEPYTRVPWTVE